MINMIKKVYKFLTSIIILLLVIVPLYSCDSNVQIDETLNNTEKVNDSNYNIIDEEGTYTSKDDVALYIYTYKKLPKNFITKNQAKKLGWDSAKNDLSDVAKGMSIGGDIFRNNERLLPTVKGRTYYECDIDYKKGSRNAKRIIYADDFDESYGFIFYTNDHYNSFEKLY